MYCENCGKEISNGATYRPGRAAAAPEQTKKRKNPLRSGAALVLAAAMIVLVLTGCGDGKKDSKRFETPEEYYRYVESAAVASAAQRLGERYDGALEATGASGRKVETEMKLELFKPATDMLETYTGYDFSWLQSLGLTANMDLAEDGAAMELALSLNGRELIGVEALLDIAEDMLYGRIPLLSEEYFQTKIYAYRLYELDMLREIAPALPDAEAIPDILSRCAEAALENVGDVEQGSDTLSAGGVSEEYTTLTVTLTEDDLYDMAKDACKILKKDEDIEECFLKLEDGFGAGIYDNFLDVLDELPDRIALAEDIEMTLYVDEDDVIRGRVIEYGDYILRYAMPEDDGEFGFELSVENADDDEILLYVSGDGERDGDTLSGTFVFEADETELLTVSIKKEGADSAEITIRPTYEYYTYFGIYSLTARALEGFSYTLKVEEDDAALEVYMDGEPFLTLTAHAESGPAEALPVVSRAKDIETWAQSLARSGLSYLNYLKNSDLPPELLQRLFFG